MLAQGTLSESGGFVTLSVGQELALEIVSVIITYRSNNKGVYEYLLAVPARSALGSASCPQAVLGALSAPVISPSGWGVRGEGQLPTPSRASNLILTNLLTQNITKYIS